MDETQPTRELEREETGLLQTVGYSAIALLARACAYPKGWERGHVRWAAVGKVFCVGSTTAIKLCEALQINPHDVLPVLNAGDEEQGVRVAREAQSGSSLSGAEEIARADQLAKRIWNNWFPNREPTWGKVIAEDKAFAIASAAALLALRGGTAIAGEED